MYVVLRSLLVALLSTVQTRGSLQLEVLALRHQLGVLQRTNRRRIRIGATDRLLWVALHRLWPEWRTALVLVKPDTVIAWHRKGFRLYWRWKSRRERMGRPGTPKEIQGFCKNTYGVKFPMYQKTHAAKRDADPLYRYLGEKGASIPAGTSTNICSTAKGSWWAVSRAS